MKTNPGQGHVTGVQHPQSRAPLALVSPAVALGLHCEIRGEGIAKNTESWILQDLLNQKTGI